MVTTIMWFACIYHSLGINYQGEVYKWTFLDCIYFSTVTWTTLGFGDFTPTADSRFYAAIEAVFGYLYSGILISIFLHWITYSNSTTKS
nr:potassium channel family protein [Pseudoalteromonas sp. A22]